jgi:Bacterial archaeo-eukaryotic release factor family 10
MFQTKYEESAGWAVGRRCLFQRHVENYRLHHAKEVINALEHVVRNERIEHVILAGDQETIIPLLREQMSEELSERVIDVFSLGIDSPEHEVLEESLIAYRRYNSLSDMEKVEHLLHEYRADGLAVAACRKLSLLFPMGKWRICSLLLPQARSNLIRLK